MSSETDTTAAGGTDAAPREPTWLSIDQLARLLDVRVDHLRALVSRGEIPVGRVGRLVRFHWPTVQRWVVDQGRLAPTRRQRR